MKLVNKIAMVSLVFGTICGASDLTICWKPEPIHTQFMKGSTDNPFTNTLEFEVYCKPITNLISNTNPPPFNGYTAETNYTFSNLPSGRYYFHISPVIRNAYDKDSGYAPNLWILPQFGETLQVGTNFPRQVNALKLLTNAPLF